MSSEHNSSSNSAPRGADVGRPLYKPGCAMMLAPGLFILGFILVVVLAGWSMWITLPVIAGVILFTILMMILKKDANVRPDGR